MTNTTAISFDSVNVAYDDKNPILENLNFSISNGEKVALVGLNGSGKTSMLKACIGLVPYTGDITVGATLLKPGTAEIIRRQIGFLFNVPEDQLLFPKVLEDVMFSLMREKLSGNDRQNRCKKALEQLGIAHLANNTLHHLSHGQKQRVALAGALVSNPRLLLLDEPTSGLDPLGKIRLQNILIQQKSAVLMTTHDLEFTQNVCDRYLFLEGGKLIDNWSLSKIKTHWHQTIESEFRHNKNC